MVSLRLIFGHPSLFRLECVHMISDEIFLLSVLDLVIVVIAKVNAELFSFFFFFFFFFFCRFCFHRLRMRDRYGAMLD